MILPGKLSNPNNNAVFQAELYQNIDPKTDKAIIAATHRPSHAMHYISTSANRLLMHFLIRNDIDNNIITLWDTCGGCARLLFCPVPVFFTHNTAHFPTVC